MAVVILDDFPGWSTVFELKFLKEQSRHASSRTRTKDLGDAIWVGEWRSKQLLPNALDYWSAVLQKLENSDSEFEAWKSSRARPMQHSASGAPIPAGPMTIGTLGGDNKSFTISGATGLLLRIGDLVQVGTNDLYKVETNADNGASIEVIPNIWPGTSDSAAVSVIKPKCYMTIVPGSIQTPSGLNGRGTVVFRGIESRG